ncbi:MAG TPA: sulfotransferase domain-containing protein [Rariglobus sp.]|jgi:hypothetical protein|nr:sulfotransferase domain-containing protein [Rariglobus sp.]
MPFFPPFSGLISLLKKDASTEAKAKRVAQREVDRYNAITGNPYLVSFPRTGSHWLRMLSELYFERPTLVRPFHFRGSTNYLYLHHHDVDLDLQRENVIYLYREPVSTVYSQLTYHNMDLNCEDSIRQTTELYANHVEKWLCRESFTTRKTILNYGKLQADLIPEFKKLTDHLGLPLDQDRLLSVSAQITKDKVKQKTVRHDDKVVNQCADYADQRCTFKTKHEDLIWKVMLEGRPHLGEYFPR